MRPARRAGRPKAQSSDVIRERILFEAERLFAEGGYEGTSIRNVAAACGCQLQAVGYHFGQKEQLFDTVVARRAKVMNAMRAEALAAMRAEVRGKAIPIDRLVRAYVSPFIESANGGDEGWRNYAALMGRLANSKLGTSIIARHYNETARSYIVEFKRSLPRASERSVVNGVLFMIASMLGICADTGRAGDLSEFETDGDTADLERLVNFTVAGLLALEQRDSARRSKRTR